MDQWLQGVVAEVKNFGKKAARQRLGSAGALLGTFTPASRARNKLRACLHVELLESRLTPSAVINVNAGANVHAINPLIYGSAFATTAQIADLNLTINRDGGNSSDTYNWLADASNHASDWYYESIAGGSGNGQSLDAFVSQSKAGGAQADLTVPILPYVASLGPNGSDLGSYPVSVFGPQQSTDPYAANFGNGVTPGGQNITDTNPLYNYVANSPAFEQTWLQHLLNTFGTPGNGGVQYFTLGNEPGLWNSTHMDIHPSGETNTELLNDFISYGSMIKSIDPSAQILGPEEWGWTNYFVDGADAAAGNYGATYDGLNVEQWLLQQLDQYQAQNGVRLLDYFTLHYYPEESVNGDNNGGVDSNNVDQATELLRNQVTRSLWDPNYVDPSWIANTGINGGKVDLIPMMQSWVNAYYPGTQTGITEYNFGAEGDMNGATTQADVYGVFGQQGLDLATRWTTPAAGTPTYLAMKLWRNYDGNDSGFGDTSVAASVANPDQTDAFAALRSSDGALTVAVINKNLFDPNNPSVTTSITINLSGFTDNGVAQEWQLAAINPSDQTNAAITHLSDVTFSGNSFTLKVPMESVTMFVIEPASAQAPKITTNPTSETLAAGLSASFTAAATGTPTPSVQWQVSTNGGGSFSNISGATATMLNFTATAALNGKEYQAVFTNAAGSAITNAATLIVNTTPQIITPLSPPPVADGSLLSVTIAATTPIINGSPVPFMFSLGPGAPAGAAIDPETGLFTWTPSEWSSQSPGVFGVTVLVAETNAPRLVSTATFAVTVEPSSMNQGSGILARQTTAVGLTQSAEYYSNVITAAYDKYLGRGPDANGLAYWLNLMQHQGLSDEHLEAGFIGSTEYISAHAGAGAGWVTGMYVNLLGRTPAPSEVQYWLNQLAGGTNTSEIAYGFAASQERESQHVAADYEQYLGRSAGATEVSYWVNVFLNGGSNEQVIAGFISSKEYFQTHGNNIVDWLFANYRAVLGRNPDSTGYEYWLNQLELAVANRAE